MNIPDDWKKGVIIKLPKKMTLAMETATTGVGSRYFPLPARASAASFYSVWQRL